MKKLTTLLLLILFLTGCLFEEDDVITKGLSEVSLSASRNTYSESNSSDITLTVDGAIETDSKVILWKVDNEEYKEGGAVLTVSPEKFDGVHLVRCMVIEGSDTMNLVTRLTSNNWMKLPAVRKYGRLQVIGTNLCDENGFPVQLKGMSTHGIQYFSYFSSENMIKSLAENWKADILRIACYVNETSGYLDSYLEEPQKWKDHIDQMVDYAEVHGIYALIDWHMLSPGDPGYYIEEAKEFWDYMSKKHGDKKHVLFDICNEPNNGGLDEGYWDSDAQEWVVTGTIVEGKDVTWTGDIKPYAEKIMKIIRNENSSRNVSIVGTPRWASQPNAVIGNKLDYDNMMYTMHFYAADHGESYRKNVINAVEGGVPVFVTEFGTQNASGEGANDFGESEKWLNLLDKYNISWCNWNLSNDWRSGAVYTTRYRPVTVDDYSNPSNMKEAGKWIFDKIKNR